MHVVSTVSQSNDALYELTLFSVLAQYYAMSKSLNDSQWTERYIPLHDLTLESNEKSERNSK